METTIELKIENAINSYASMHKIMVSGSIRNSVSMLKPCPENFPQEFFTSSNVTGRLNGKTVIIVCKDEEHITHCLYDQVLEKSRQPRTPSDYIPRPRHSFNFGQMVAEFI